MNEIVTKAVNDVKEFVKHNITAWKNTYDLVSKNNKKLNSLICAYVLLVVFFLLHGMTFSVGNLLLTVVDFALITYWFYDVYKND